jgi:hypothetical protein
LPIDSKDSPFFSAVHGRRTGANSLQVNRSGGFFGTFQNSYRANGAASDGLIALRPVAFQLKNDPNNKTRFGLIAEEVAKIYPDLVIRDENGR